MIERSEAVERFRKLHEDALQYGFERQSVGTGLIADVLLHLDAARRERDELKAKLNAIKESKQ